MSNNFDVKISVIIPFYRRQHVFEETLNSVLSQTLLPYEIIVVDDASGGDALEYLNKFSSKIRIVALPRNGGVSFARNVGVAAASGDYIAFNDSDDIWHPQKLEKQIAYLLSTPECHLVHTGCVNFFPDGVEKEYLAKPFRLFEKDMIVGSHVMFQSVLMPRNIFLDTKGFDPKFRQTEDYEYSFRLVVNKYNIDFIPEPLVRIRHGGEDKLSKNWKGFIFGHARVVWQNRSVYTNLEGVFGVHKHLMKYLYKGGHKQKGKIGFFLRMFAKALYPFPY